MKHELITATGMTADQFFEMMKTAVRQVLAEAGHEPEPSQDLPDLISAAEAAEILRYRSTRTLKKFHTDGRLKPIRRGRKALFYKREQVEKLKTALFGK